MHRTLLRWLLALIRLAFWIAALFVLVCLLGSLRFLQPGVNPSVTDFTAFGLAVLSALGLFVLFYVFDTFTGAPEPEEWESAAAPLESSPRPQNVDVTPGATRDRRGESTPP
jgi:hypothetical protein